MILALFKGGHEVRRVDAPTILSKVTEKNGGSYTDAAFERELESFIGPI